MRLENLVGVSGGPSPEQASRLALVVLSRWTTNRSATRPDALHPVHRHDVGCARTPIGWSSGTVAIAMRHERQCAIDRAGCPLSRKARARRRRRLAVAVRREQKRLCPDRDGYAPRARRRSRRRLDAGEELARRSSHGPDVGWEALATSRGLIDMRRGSSRRCGSADSSAVRLWPTGPWPSVE